MNESKAPWVVLAGGGTLAAVGAIDWGQVVGLVAIATINVLGAIAIAIIQRRDRR